MLVKNVSKAIKDSKAMRFYISNIMTQPGQTDNYTLSDHFKAIEEHIGTGVFDYCLADTGEIVPEYVRKYNKEGSDIVEYDNSRLNGYNIRIIQKDMSCIKNGKISHNPEIIASTIIEMICNDLKFHDMQNNTEYLLLQSVLKEQKKKQAREEKMKKKQKYLNGEIPEKKEKAPRRDSKFSEKYKDRVMSIQNADKNISENRRIAEERSKEETANNFNNKKDPFRRKNKNKKRK